MNTDKTRLTIMNGLEVKKGILDNCKIIDCKFNHIGLWLF